MDYTRSTRADIARHFVKHYGFKVLPVKANDKAPAITHGVNDASDDPELVSKWFESLSESGNEPNIGIACGQASGIVVVDVDLKIDDDAFLNASELCGHEDLWEPETLIVDTPGQGQHWYFKAPNFAVGNSVGLVSGVDIRGDGGYVVAPGSTISGRRYEFAKEGEIASLPEPLLRRLKPEPAGILDSSGNDLTWETGTGAKQGERNDALFRFGCRIIDHGVTREELLAVMHARNSTFKPPLSDEEVFATAKNIIINYGRDQKSTDQSNCLLTLIDLRNMPRPVPLISDVLYSDMEHCLFGPQGVSKTFLSLDMALHIIHGKRWFDKNVQPGRVVYVCGEGGGRVLADRLDAWHTHHLLDDSLTIERLRITEFPVPLLIQEDVDELLLLIHGFGHVQLVIIDTLSANFGPGDENAQADMGRFCAAARRIRLETRAGIIVVHHTGHADKTRPQGANRIRRDFDVELRVDADDTDDGLFGLMGGGQLKNRNSKGCGLLAYRLETVDLDRDDFGDRVESAVVVPTSDEPNFSGKKVTKPRLGKNQNIVLDALRQIAIERGEDLCDPDGVYVNSIDLARARKNSKLPKQRWYDVMKKFDERGVTQPTVGGIKWFPNHSN